MARLACRESPHSEAPMSWDVIAFNFDGASPLKIDDLDETTLRPMGSTQNVRERISTCLDGVDWSDPTWGIFEGDGFSFEFNVGEDKVETKDFMIHVRGRGDAVCSLLKFAVPNKWSLLDCSTSEFIDPTNPSNEGWEKFQAFRDRAIGAVAPKKIQVHPTPKNPWWKLW